MDADKLIQRLKPRSTVWRTTLVIGLVVVVSQYLSVAFFAFNLYAPEIKQHAHLAAAAVKMLREAEQALPEHPEALGMQSGVQRATGIEIIRDPDEFPGVKDKFFAELFTDFYAKQLSLELAEPVDVYFEFKPQPTLWIYLPSMKDAWLKESVVFFADYNPFVIIGWLLGVPFMTLVATVVLVRQLNRPLRRLELAALRVARGSHNTQLETERGPREIRAVNGAFNYMTNKIQQAAKDRAFMLAGISHDLRTPLTRMRLTAEMMQDADLAEGMILDIQDMDAILEQFIAFMRDGSDEKVELCNLNQILQEVEQQFSHQIEVHLLPGDIPDMRMKRTALKRMVSNLVSNAMRYGQPPVELSTCLVNGKIELVVRDHGAGVASEDIPRLLQPFQRGEQARSGQGTGLGLAIVERIVKLHHGTLEVSNHPEGGLMVLVRLPVNRRPA